MIAMLPCRRTKNEHFGGKFDNPCALFSRIYFVSTFPSMPYFVTWKNNKRVTKWSQGNLPFVLTSITHTYAHGEVDIWKKQASGITSHGLKSFVICSSLIIIPPFLLPNILHKHCLGFLLGPQLFFSVVTQRSSQQNLLERSIAWRHVGQTKTKARHNFGWQTHQTGWRCAKGEFRKS